ncbi:response regulator [Undibacterium sp. Di27W]|uniref:response regulator n=1 Tax=Undibacterium sp. Di27W TaxID=3413036 RepID=UPI003BF0C7CD
MRMLLVEDDPMIGESIEEALRSEAYAVDWVRDGLNAELALGNQDYDLVLLDLGLPKKSGLDVLQRYRRQGGAVPVLIITARDAKASRIEGLDAGADDYLIKPFDVDELMARIRAVLRRHRGYNQSSISHGGVMMNLATHEVTLNDAIVHLSAREFSVLRALLDAGSNVVPKSQLEDRIYGWGDEIESNAIDVYIHHLRRKLGADFIKNVRGVGYKLMAAE